jgi:hypothetical protein
VGCFGNHQEEMINWFDRSTGMAEAKPVIVQAHGDGIHITLAIVSCYVCLGAACLAARLM